MFGSGILGSMTFGKRSKSSMPFYLEDHIIWDVEKHQFEAYSLMMFANAHDISSSVIKFNGRRKMKYLDFKMDWKKMDGVKE